MLVLLTVFGAWAVVAWVGALGIGRGIALADRYRVVAK